MRQLHCYGLKSRDAMDFDVRRLTAYQKNALLPALPFTVAQLTLVPYIRASSGSSV